MAYVERRPCKAKQWARLCVRYQHPRCVHCTGYAVNDRQYHNITFFLKHLIPSRLMMQSRRQCCDLIDGHLPYCRPIWHFKLLDLQLICSAQMDPLWQRVPSTCEKKQSHDFHRVLNRPNFSDSDNMFDYLHQTSDSNI